jgi:hypothetical protein
LTERLVRSLTQALPGHSQDDPQDVLWIADVLWLIAARAGHQDDPAAAPADLPGPPARAAPGPADRAPAAARPARPPDDSRPALTLEPADGAAPGGWNMRASAVELARPARLPRPPSADRVLAPFKRVRHAGRPVIDLEATVEATAYAFRLVVKTQPERERGLDIALVADSSTVMPVFGEALAEFQGLLRRAGAFRSVTRWTLEPGIPAGSGWSRPQMVIRDDKGGRHAPDRLIDPSGRRLVLLATDGLADHWYRPAAWQVLDRWARAMPAAVIHLLPARHRSHGAFGGSALLMRSPRPAAPNSEADVQAAWWNRGPLPGRGNDDVAVPVISLRRGELAAWAEAVTGGAAWTNAVLVRPPSGPAPAEANRSLTAQDRVRAFRASASQGAQALARALADIPRLSVPLMTAIQARLRHGTQASELAELLVAGLLEQVVPAGADQDGARHDEAGQDDAGAGTGYLRFRPGVSELLGRGITVAQQWATFEAALDFVREDSGTSAPARQLIAENFGVLGRLAEQLEVLDTATIVTRTIVTAASPANGVTVEPALAGTQPRTPPPPPGSGPDEASRDGASPDGVSLDDAAPAETEQAETEQAGTELAGAELAGTELAGAEPAETEQAETELERASPPEAVPAGFAPAAPPVPGRAVPVPSARPDADVPLRRLAADTEAASLPGAAAVSPADPAAGLLAELVARLGPVGELAIVQVAAPGIILWRIRRDRAGTPVCRFSPELPWASLQEHGVLTEEALYQAVRFGDDSEPVLLSAPPAGPEDTWALSVLAAAYPAAPLIRTETDVAALIRHVLARTPLTRAYGLVVLRPDTSAQLELSAAPLFPVGARRGDRQALPILCEASDADGTVLAVVAGLPGRQAVLMSAQAVKLPPGGYDLAAELARPGLVRFGGLPAPVHDERRAWPQIVDRIPDLPLWPPRPVHLICAVETSGPHTLVEDRIGRAGQLVRLAADELEQGLSVSLIAYGPHSFHRGERDEPPEILLWAASGEAAVAELARLYDRPPAPPGYPDAAQVECVLADIADLLRRIRGPDREHRVLVTLGSSPSFPPRPDISGVLPCRRGLDWRAMLRRLEGDQGLALGAICDDPRGARSPMWIQLGRHSAAFGGLVVLRAFAEPLGLLRPPPQLVPLPLLAADEAQPVRLGGTAL